MAWPRWAIRRLARALPKSVARPTAAMRASFRRSVLTSGARRLTGVVFRHFDAHHAAAAHLGAHAEVVAVQSDAGIEAELLVGAERHFLGSGVTRVRHGLNREHVRVI